MKFSVNWLREFVELPDNIDNLCELLTMAGVEIEGVENRGVNIDKVVVAQITASSPHPNADRLTVCEVEDGSGKRRQIVCGAKNYKVGDKVPLALPGAVLPGGLGIQASKLRGVASEGMLCSAKELGVAEDAAGLLILSADAKIGAPISDLFPNDAILDVEITPNRGDLLSHFGLAREISAIVGQALRLPSFSPAGDAPALQHQGVAISAARECPFYSARRIDNIQVGPSPDWLRAKIESTGIRSINNIVDISNFVMLELGQPTHAFDADKLKGAINVRLARDGEKFLALDGKIYSLSSNDLVIADQERVVGIGGVMGGEETGVTESTKNVLLEAAYFLPASVRRTARSLSLPSDASYRFERGVDPGMILHASQRAADLMQEIAGGNPAKEVLTAGELPADPSNVRLRYDKCDKLLGINVPSKEVDGALERFGLEKIAKKKTKGENETEWKVPSYRRDLARDVDLIEEVVRAHGVGKIPGSTRSRSTPASETDRSHDREMALRERLTAHGLFEVRTSALIPRNSGPFATEATELRNPLSEDHVALRPSLVPGLLGVLERNVRAGAPSTSIFELGRTFIPPETKEELRLGVLFAGSVQSASRWRDQIRRRFDFFDLKGALESAFRNLSFRQSEREGFALAADIQVGDRVIGFAGQLAASAGSGPHPIQVAEVAVSPFLARETDARTFRELEKFPGVTRDIAMLVPENVNHAQIADVIKSGKEAMLESVKLFDLFAGQSAENADPGRKSLAYTLTYRDKNRTLTTDEVSAVHAKIRERLKSELGVELRENVL